MVELTILNGRLEGQTFSIAGYPVTIGRGPEADLVLEEPGIWDRHFQIQRSETEGFLLAVDAQTQVGVNGEFVRSATLRNGDLLEAGSCRIRFGLSPNQQKSLGWREALVWLFIAGLTLLQVALIYWLL